MTTEATSDERSIDSNPTSSSLWRSLKDRLWGYDFFVSYHWASGGAYAVNLAQRLRDLHYDVFLDRADYASGDDWKVIGERALRNTQRLVLVATREAVTISKPVEREVRIFTDRSRQVISIVFGDRFEDLDRSEFPTLNRMRDSQIYIDDGLGANTVGPSDATISELVRTHRVMRRRNLRALLTFIPAVAVIAFAIIAGVSWWQTSLAERDARESAVAEGAARQIAEEKRLDAENQRLLALERLQRARRGANSLQLLRTASILQTDPAAGLALLEDTAHCPFDLRDWTWRYLHRLCKRETVLTTNESHSPQSVAFSPRGDLLASGGRDGTVELWDYKTGRRTGTLEGYDSNVTSLCFSSDGQRLASATQWGMIKVWRIGDRTEVADMQGTNGQNVALTPDGGQLFVGGIDGSLTRRNLLDGSQSQIGEKLDRGIWSLTISSDGNTVAVGAGSGKILLYNTQSGELVKTLEQTSGIIATEVRGVAFSSDNKLIAATALGSAKVWNLEGEHEVVSLRGDFRSISFLPNEPTLVAADLSGNLSFFDLESGKANLVLQVGRSSDIHLADHAVSSDGMYLASGGEHLKLWRLIDHRDVTIENAQDRWSAALSSDGTVLATGTDDGKIHIADAQNGKRRTTLLGHKSIVHALAFSPDGKLLASSGDAEAPTDHEIFLWDVDQGVQLAVFDPESQAQKLIFSPDGQTIVSYGGGCEIWDIKTKRRRQILEDYGNSSAACFSPDGRILAFLESGTATLLETATWTPQSTIRGRSGIVGFAICFSPGGQHLAVAEFKQVRLWEIQSGLEIARLTGHQDAIREIHFTNDGQTIATVADDVRLWDSVTGHARGAISGGVESLRFNEAHSHLLAVPHHGGRSEEGDTFVTIRLTSARADPAILKPAEHAQCLIADGGRLFAGTGAEFEEGYTCEWDLNTGEEISSLKGHPSGVTSLAISGDGNVLASASARPMGHLIPGEVRLWSPKTKKVLGVFQIPEMGVAAVALSLDGRLLAVGCADEEYPRSEEPRIRGEVRIYDRESLQEMYRARFPEPVTALSSTPDMRRLAVVDGGRLQVWTPTNSQSLQEIATPWKIHCVSVSPDGRSLIFGGEGDVVRVWDLVNNRPIMELPVGKSPIHAIAWSSTGGEFATGNSDGLVTVWNARTGQAVHRKQSYGKAASLALSPTGRRLIATFETGGDHLRREGHLLVWDLSASEQLDAP